MGYQKTFEKLSKKVCEILKNSPRCHDWEHTLRVLNNARMIGGKEKKCDMRVVEIGALFHDIARADELAIKGKICHAKKGAKLTEEILKSDGLNEELIEKVVKCVRRHRYRGKEFPVSIEEKIIYDADKLDSLGAIGIGRAFLFAGRIGAKVHNTPQEAVNSKSYSENDTAYREYLVKLKYLPSKMMTASGKKIAQKRLNYMKSFFNKLDSEIFGKESK